MGAYTYFSTESLNRLRDSYEQALVRIAEVGVSHTISGRTFTAANITEIHKLLEEVSAELDTRTNRVASRTRINFNRCFMR
jgi:hypothetical protein